MTKSTSSNNANSTNSNGATTTKKIKIVHERRNCIGCNSCVTLAPCTWRMSDEDGKSILIGSQQKGQDFVGETFTCNLEANKAAAEACPVNIIKVIA